MMAGGIYVGNPYLEPPTYQPDPIAEAREEFEQMSYHEIAMNFREYIQDDPDHFAQWLKDYCDDGLPITTKDIGLYLEETYKEQIIEELAG